MEDDFYEDDVYSDDERGAFDLDLLLSVAGGLGRSHFTDEGRKVYEKDPDCLGRWFNLILGVVWGACASTQHAGGPNGDTTCCAASRSSIRTLCLFEARPPSFGADGSPPIPDLARHPHKTACLKDLQRFLRRDDPDSRDVFFKLGELQVRLWRVGAGCRRGATCTSS
jgi:hypothetical protein